MPSSAAKKMICQIWIRLVRTSQPSPTANAICAICVAIRIFRLSNRSAAEPPIMVSARVGTPAAKLAIPRRIALFVSVLMTHPWAMTCIQVPVSEIAEPMIYRRNAPGRKSASALCPIHFSSALIAKTHKRGEASLQLARTALR